MRLQLISFAWRILNTPGACFAAVSSVRDNSIREVMEREELWQPLAIPRPRGSDPPGFKEKSQENGNKSHRWQSVWLGSKALLWWDPSRSASMSPDRAPSLLSTRTLPRLPACPAGISRSFPVGLSSNRISPRPWMYKSMGTPNSRGLACLGCCSPSHSSPGGSPSARVGFRLADTQHPLPSLCRRGALARAAQGSLGSSWHSWDVPKGSGGRPKGTVIPKGDRDPQGHPGPEAGWEAGTSGICSGRVVTAELLDLLAKGLMCPACCAQTAPSNLCTISSGL